MHFTLHTLAFCVTLFIAGSNALLLGPLTIPVQNFFKLSHTGLVLVSSSIFAGQILGGSLSGTVSRMFDRSTVLIAMLSGVTCATYLSSAPSSFVFFGFLRGVVGVCLGVTIPIAQSIYTESIPSSSRGFLLTIVWVSFGMGGLYNCLLIKWITPVLQIEAVKLISQALGATYLFFTLLMLFLQRDSIISYIVTGQKETAFEIMSDIYGRPLNENTKKSTEEDAKNAITNNQSSQSMLLIFSKRYASTTFLIAGIWGMSALAGYGTNLILPDFLKKLNLEKNVYNAASIIHESIYTYLGAIASALIGAFLVERKAVGRRYTMAIASGLAVLFVTLAIIFWHQFAILFSIAMVGILMVYNVIGTYASEVFPFHLRLKAISFAYSLSKIGSLSSQPLFIWLSTFDDHFTPFYLCIFLMLLCLGCSIVLKYETKGRKLDEDFSESEEDLQVLKPNEELNNEV